jgi:SAM-dependent methyltransferase
MLLSIDQTLDKKELLASMKSVYNTIYSEHGYNPINSLGCWSIISRVFSGFKEALDVGCGMGYGLAEARRKRLNVYGCDISNLTKQWKKLGIDAYCRVAPAHSMPYKTGRFDLVVCSDVMEHIPEKMVDDTLKEIYRVGNMNYFFHICSHLENSKDNLMDKGICVLHITIKPDEWWHDKLRENGFKILGSYKYDDDPGLLDITATKADGVDVSAVSFKRLDVEQKPFDIKFNETGRMVWA